jgi:hypothetical protein
LSNYLFTDIIKQLLIINQQIETVEQLLVILGNNMTTADNYSWYARLQVCIKQQSSSSATSRKASKREAS